MTDENEVTKPKIRSELNATRYGYVLEWRLKPESIALEAILEGVNEIRAHWTQANYTVAQIVKAQGSELVAPMIQDRDVDIGRHDLVRRKVAEALYACLRTSTKDSMLPHIEWRIVRVRVKESYKLEDCPDDGVEHEELMNELFGKL